MTEVEFTNLRGQVTQLQGQLESRTEDWRKLSVMSRSLAVLFAVLAFAFIVASFWLDAKSFPTAHGFVTIMGYQFLLVSLPLSLLGQALRARR